MSQNRSKAYTDAGVNIEEGNQLVSRIKSSIAATHIQGVLSDIGGFGGLFRPDLTNMQDPVLVASTDGVGTKVKLAVLFDKHDTIGIDLVAMSVNDILVQGARPLFFLDYFATGTLDAEKAETIINGVAEGCKQAKCALLGGETAEMGEMYAKGEYDLAGFCVGIADNAQIVDGSTVSVGDLIIGLASSGIHSNGYSLVRKLLEKSGLQADDTLPGCDGTVRDVLLEPTKIYVQEVRSVMRDVPIKSMVHITGGGFYDNIPRMLPQSVKAEIRFGSWNILPVFEWLRNEGDLSWPEMLQIFNCGLGYIMVVDKNRADDVLERLSAMDMPSWIIGSIAPRQGNDDENGEQVDILF